MRFDFRALSTHLHRLTFLGGNLHVAVRRRTDSGGRSFCFGNNVISFIRCVGGGGMAVFPRVVRCRTDSSVCVLRITLRCGSNCKRRLFSFIGGVGAVRNNARITNFGNTLAGTYGGQTRRFNILGGSRDFSDRSIHRKLITMVDVGIPRPRFRNRAGKGLNGDSMGKLIRS